MFKKTNKKGFTLIELIIVVAIMAVLVALLAPNVLKYLEKSKVGKDINSLDSVRLAVEAELMDDKLSTYTTDAAANGLQGKFLSTIDAATTGDDALLGTRLFDGDKVLDAKFSGATLFSSKAAKDYKVAIFVDGKGGIVVAAVNTAGTGIASYDGTPILVSTKINLSTPTITNGVATIAELGQAA